MKDSCRQLFLCLPVSLAMLSLAVPGKCSAFILCAADSCQTVPADTSVYKSITADGDNEGKIPLYERILPKSPQAAALEKYGDIPVSMATGVPDISIPLYTIRLGEYSLPISISYHASGIKPDEIATCVGLGWTLNAGGAVTRTIRGLSDLKEYSMERDTLFWSYDRCMKAAADISTAGNIIPVTAEMPYHDTEADRYVYSFAGKSGAFIYSQEDGRFVPLNYDTFAIYAESAGGTSFHIADTDGTDYDFAQQERSGCLDTEGVSEVSAWYLTAIHTRFGDISIRYRKFASIETRVTRRSLKVGEFAEIDEFGVPMDRHIAVASEPAEASARYRCEQVLPTEIEWNGNRIVFEYAEDRKDLGTARLVRMAVISRDGETVKTVTFDNCHYAGNAYTSNGGTRYSSLRMTLDAVCVSGVGKYAFGYNRSIQPPYYRMGDSPELYNCGTDLWGYWNGSDTRYSVPYTLVKDAYDSFSSSSHWHRPFEYTGPKNSRSPRLEYASMLALNEITYPTGGTARLTYELNTPLGRFGGLRVRSISCGDMTRTFSYADNADYDIAENMMWKWKKEFFWGNFMGHAMTDYIECDDTPAFPESDSGGHGVFYPEVTETFANGERTVYRFDTGRFRDRGGGALSPSCTDSQPSPQMMQAALNDEGNVAPILVGKATYGSDDGLVAEESYEYEPVLVRRFATGTRVYCPIVNLRDIVDYYTTGGVNIIPVVLHIYCRRTYGWSRIFNLKSKTVTDCASGVSTRTDYTYDGMMRTTLPKSVTVENSDGTLTKTVNGYAFESADSLNAVLYGKYLMADLVVGTERYCDGRLAESTRTDYGVWNGSVYPARTYRSGKDGNMYQEYSFEEYGTKGNLKRYTVNTCDTVSISWDEGDEYPMTLTKSGKEVTRYTWKPLIGVASVTVANGYTKRFGYDSAGRLDREYDDWGTIRRHEYSVKNGCEEESGMNMVKTTTPLDGSETCTVENIGLYDGFGRICDRVNDGVNEDMVPVHSFCTYDERGRIKDTFLPFPMDGAEKEIDTEKARAASLLIYGDNMAFSTVKYDALDRNTGTSTAGEAWTGKGKTMEYVGNTEKDVRLFHAPLGKVSLVDDGYYRPGTLYGEKDIDEDGHTLTVFSDRLGRKILERRNDGTTDNDTYFVYNDLGQLRYVLSPEYQNAGYKGKYAYEYRYDGRGNLVKKILPGCGFEQYWYDRGNRMTFMQDAALRERGLYRFFLYDRLGRLVVQGTCTACERDERPNIAEYEEKGGGICNTGYKVPFIDKITNPNLETVNYYDRYDFIDGYAPMLGNGIADFRISGANADGLPTGCVQVASDGTRVLSALFYDSKGRVTDARQLTEGRRLTAVHTEYSYTGKPVRTETKEYGLNGGDKRLAASLIQENGYSKNTDKLLDITLTVNGKTQTVQRIEYDKLGRVNETVRGGNAGTVSHEYNLHGWTMNIKSKDFSEELHYTDGVGMPCYNGNVSSMLWRTSEYPQTRGYKFTYDGLDRLTEAVYGEGESLSDKRNRYNEKVVEYTANGAIRRFQRRGLKDDGEYGKIDNLNVRLDGNRLLSVTDDALPVNKYSSMSFIDGADEEVEYTYNGVGAMTSDLNRGITDIEYDNLNNPRRILFKDGTEISYTYLSDGTKLSKTVSVGGGMLLSDSMTTEFSGDIVYENGRLDKVLFHGGYCTFENGCDNTTFHYFTQDHLGNNRTVVNEDGTVEQITHYYPFGGTFNDVGLNPELQQYKYNGKELDRTAGLNTYDYGARMYFQGLPTWDRMDPLCEEDYPTSPYAYCRNNPIKNIDKDGMKVRPSGLTELKMIRNTIPKEFRQYVQLDQKGFIDKDIINSHESNSVNYVNLKTLVNSNYVVNVILDNKFSSISPDGIISLSEMSYYPYDEYSLGKDLYGETLNGLTTGESGFMGKTLFPDRDGFQNSINDDINVVVNKELSPEGAAQVYSHEANGHALLYILTEGNHKAASHQAAGMDDLNYTLKEMILKSKKETIRNMKE